MALLMVDWPHVIKATCSNLRFAIIKPKYAKIKKPDDHDLFGLCYAASEAYYYIQKGRGLNVSGAFKKMTWRGEKITHWVVIHNDTGEVVDLTAEQYQGEINLDYSTFTKRGFYPQMSKACATILKAIRANASTQFRC